MAEKRVQIEIKEHSYYVRYQVNGEDANRIQFPPNMTPVIPREGEIIEIKDNRSDTTMEFTVQKVSYKSFSKPADQSMVHEIKIALV